MYQFTNDYSHGAHPKVMEALNQTNMEQHQGYTVDAHCNYAASLICDACELDPKEASVEFVIGGTQANVCALLGLLDRPYDAVVCAPSGHINVHEAGAIEACGHKAVCTQGPCASQGFVSVDELDQVVREHAAFMNHMVRPRVIYISHTTELGGIYSDAMLSELSEYAHKHDMKLYVDGARLASGLTSEATDLTLQRIAHLADAFTLGGTKSGLLFGEAIISRNAQLSHDLPWIMKQQGALLAKGRLLGVQFTAALEHGDIWQWARSSNKCASMLRAGLLDLGLQEYLPSTTNQLFFCVSNELARICTEELGCEIFFEKETQKIIRFVTSWATTTNDVQDALDFVRANK